MEELSSIFILFGAKMHLNIIPLIVFLTIIFYWVKNIFFFSSTIAQVATEPIY